MLRIVSDLHLFDGASRVRDLQELDPLFDGVATFVVNGDSCDTQLGTTPAQVTEIRNYLARRAPEVTLITGNHDPDISEVHELSLAGGRVWLTHGDVFFPEATPWSAILPELRRRITAARAAAPHEPFDRLETRWRIFRQIHRKLPIHFDLSRRDLLARLQRLAFDLGAFPRVCAMLQAWRHGPTLAAATAAAQREAAQVVVFGHIHRPSLSRPHGRIVINTGAFAGPFGAWCVDLNDERVIIRTIDRRRGSFRPGEVVQAIPLAAPTAARLTTAA